MEQEIVKSQSTNNKEGNLKAILFLLQNYLEEFKNEVDQSYALLKIGEMTELSKKLDAKLNNPFLDVFEASDKIENQVKNIVNLFVKSFFKIHNNIISSVYRSKTPLKDLHYSIVLKDDSFENRDKIFDFFNKYDQIELSYKYPVYFQFVPIELIGEVKVIEELKIY